MPVFRKNIKKERKIKGSTPILVFLVKKKNFSKILLHTNLKKITGKRRHLGESSCLSISFFQTRVRNSTSGFISLQVIKTNEVSSDTRLAHSFSKLDKDL